MSKQALTIDTKAFTKKLTQLTKQATPKAIKKGMGQATLQVLNDAIEEQPTVPLREGTLRGSGSAFVNNELAHTTEAKGDGSGTPATDANEAVKPTEYVGLIGFNTPYAARLHENPDYKFKEPGSGAKYLESKLSRFRKTYMRIIARVLKESL